VKYLADTNVISEVRKGRRCNAAVWDWWSVNAADVFLSVLTIGEIRKGIEGVRRKDPRTAAALEQWLTRLTTAYSDRILPIDLDIAQEWARMSVPDPVSLIDGLLAATAKTRGLILVTRNTSDIARTGVAFLNPWVP